MSIHYSLYDAIHIQDGRICMGSNQRPNAALQVVSSDSFSPFAYSQSNIQSHFATASFTTGPSDSNIVVGFKIRMDKVPKTCKPLRAMLTTYMTDDISSEDAAVISGEQLINPMNGSNLLTHNKFKTATTGFYDLSESAFKINGDYYVCHTFKQSAVIGNIYLDLKLCANTDVGAVYIQAHASTPSSLTFNSAMAYYVDPGTGNPNNKWSKFQANDFEIGVRATNRYTEKALVSVEGNTYTVMNGARATDGSSRWGYWVSIRLLKGTFATKEIIVTITGPKGTLAMSMYNYLLAAGATPSAMSYINDSSFFSAPALASALQYATSDVGFYTVHVKVYDNLPNAAIKGKVIAGAAANFDIIQSS